MIGCSDLDKLNKICLRRGALELKGRRQIVQPRRRRFNQVQKANKVGETDVKKMGGRRD
jgi:hypothetical protein